MTVQRDQNEDAALALRAVHDRQSFGPLYDRYAVPVYRFCYRRLGNAHDAEDATSAIFTRALERLETFRGGSFPAWLFAIARSTLADRFRGTRPCAPVDLTGVDVEEPGDGPEEAAMKSDERRALATLLASLTPDQRAVIELRLAGLTGAEIAQSLGRSVPAVKMLQLRAMTRLRALAGPHPPEAECRD